MITHKSANVEVRLPSRLGYEKVAMSTAASVAKLMGFREDRIEDLKTAVAEACINAIEYGNRSAADIPVVVTLSADDRRLLVDVCDRALGATRPHMGAMVDLQNPPVGPHANMGLFLIHNLVDEVAIVCRANGTHVQMAMRFPS
jgi:serine/threonine-protein kinase RsbW